MKITHNNKTYIDAATHAGLRCWVTQRLLDNNEKSDQLGPIGDHAKDELIRYAHDPDGYRHGDILITDAEDHRKHWPMRNTHRHPLEAVGNGGGSGPEGDHAGSGRGSQSTKQPSAAGSSPALAPNPTPQPVDGGEWPKYELTPYKETLFVWLSATTGRQFCFDGRRGPELETGWNPIALGKDGDIVTPTQAAEWLRNNGHEAVAAEIEGDRFEPVGTLPVVGDVLHHSGVDFKVNEIDLADRHYYESRSATGFHRLSFSGFQDMGWRIRKRPDANALEGARVFCFKGDNKWCAAMVGSKWYQYGTLSNGNKWMPVTLSDWNRDDWNSIPADKDYSEITGTPAAKEALASLARWMEVGGGK